MCLLCCVVRHVCVMCESCDLQILVSQFFFSEQGFLFAFERPTSARVLFCVEQQLCSCTPSAAWRVLHIIPRTISSYGFDIRCCCPCSLVFLLYFVRIVFGLFFIPHYLRMSISYLWTVAIAPLPHVRSCSMSSGSAYLFRDLAFCDVQMMAVRSRWEAYPGADCC